MKIEPLSRILSGFISFFTHNSNSDKIETAFENTLSRDGSAPNAMGANLDMGSHRIINVGAPLAATDAVRLQDVTGDVTIEISGSYNDLTDVPTTFAPSAHTHPESEITGLVADLAAKASLSHNHTTGEVTGLNGAIDSRIGTHTILAGAGISKSYNAGTGELTLNASGVASTAWADLTGVPSTFTPSAHTHPESDITSLVSDLSNKAALSHTHAQSDITGLTSALSGKAASSHSHASSDITSFTADVRSQFSAGSGISIASGVITATGGGSGGLAAANNLSDVASASTSRSNLGLGSIATLSDLSSRLIAGTGISLSTGSGNTTITATGGSSLPHGYIGAWENSITTATSAATNASNLNSLITSTSSAGGGCIYFLTPGNYQISTTITMKSNVDIWMAPGCYLYWTGSTSGTIVQTDSSSSVKGLLHTVMNIHSGSGHTGVMFAVHSAIKNNIEVCGYGSSTSNIFVEINPNWAGSPTIIGEANNAFNRYKFMHFDTCGYGLYVHGDSSHITTLNTFSNMTCYQGVYGRGILLQNWCDNNEFDGFTYLYVPPAATGGIGVMCNESSPTDGGASGVYSNHWTNLAVDCFGSGSGRYGVVFNGSKHMTIDAYHCDPEPEGSSFVGTYCTSYQVRRKKQASDDIYIHQKAVSTGL